MKEEKAHAKLSASGAHRWMNCPGSVALCEKAPPQRSSKYADEGTQAHACLEFLLRNRRVVGAHDAAKLKWSNDMVKHAMGALQYVAELETGKSDTLIEARVTLDFIQPGMFGTVDVAVVDYFKTLTVIDYKYGAGVPIDPEANSQLVYYLLGLAYFYGFNFSMFKVVVIQPRAGHERGPIREWTVSCDELEKWWGWFNTAAHRANDPKAELKPGDWCRWCQAKPICPAISTKALQEAQIDFPFEKTREPALPEPKMFKGKELSNVLSAIDKIETWMEAVKEHAFHQAKAGFKIPGFKLVKKRSIRRWAHPDLAADLARRQFGELAFEPSTLVSPAQLEKRTRGGAADFIATQATNESSGETLAPESDKRPEFSSIENDFGGVHELYLGGLK